ncbi:DUF433 domain-containing protein [Paenarthrobacter sp. NPDC089675]|uniref:DUF433 domain-containing protein n=1 Tax=Paenarthrobacter sp. NPDC089675 TaxID=3364376 RepID=UPI0038059E69
MAFPSELASVLSGASMSQLIHWRATPALLVPEVASRPRALYSFRDIVALRTFVRLRSELPLQRIRTALSTLQNYDLTDHPSSYKLITERKTIFLVDEDGSDAVDLVERRGQTLLLSMAHVFAPFTNMQGQDVVDFRQPRANIEVRERRMGGWPTIAGTRVRYDTVALLLEDGSVSAEDAHFFYPQVTRQAALDAVDFDSSVRDRRLGR